MSHLPSIQHLLAEPSGTVASGTITGFPALLIIIGIAALIVVGLFTVIRKVRGKSGK